MYKQEYLISIDDYICEVSEYNGLLFGNDDNPTTYFSISIKSLDLPDEVSTYKFRDVPNAIVEEDGIKLSEIKADMFQDAVETMHARLMSYTRRPVAFKVESEVA